jgi:hypothetical protein
MVHGQSDRYLARITEVEVIAAVRRRTRLGDIVATDDDDSPADGC